MELGKWCAFVVNLGCCIFLLPLSSSQPMGYHLLGCLLLLFQLKKAKRERSGPLLELSRTTLSVDSQLAQRTCS